jgi:hypothetical protein
MVLDRSARPVRFQLLRRLAAQDLPFQLEGQTDIHALESLVLAGQARASELQSVA